MLPNCTLHHKWAISVGRDDRGQLEVVKKSKKGQATKKADKMGLCLLVFGEVLLQIES